jgi:hypothetical protein
VASTANARIAPTAINKSEVPVPTPSAYPSRDGGQTRAWLG